MRACTHGFLCAHVHMGYFALIVINKTWLIKPLTCQYLPHTLVGAHKHSRLVQEAGDKDPGLVLLNMLLHKFDRVPVKVDGLVAQQWPANRPRQLSHDRSSTEGGGESFASVIAFSCASQGWTWTCHSRKQPQSCGSLPPALKTRLFPVQSFRR